MSQNTRRMDELSYFNAIACLLVIFIHVVSYGITNAEPRSLQAALLYFPWRLSAFVVPAFLFSSAVKLSFKFSEHLSPQDYGRYLRGRFETLCIPYAVWNAVYYIVFIRIGYVSGSLPDFVTQLLLGTLSSPFYYIVIAMQFFLLQPLWFFLLKHIKWYVSIPAALLITFVSNHLNSLLSLWDTSFRFTDRIFPTYLIFWVLGLYVGQNYETVTKSIGNAGRSMIPAAAFVLLFAIVPYLQYSRGIFLFDMEYFKVIVDGLSILILLWLCLKLKDSAEWIRTLLSAISSASFSVYLSHCLFLTLATHIMFTHGHSRLAPLLIVRFLVCYSLPFATYAALKRLKAFRARRIS